MNVISPKDCCKALRTKVEKVEQHEYQNRTYSCLTGHIYLRESMKPPERGVVHILTVWLAAGIQAVLRAVLQPAEAFPTRSAGSSWKMSCKAARVETAKSDSACTGIKSPERIAQRQQFFPIMDM